MPQRLLDFVCYWRSRGVSIKVAYRLWGLKKSKFTPGDLRWASGQ